VSSLQVGEIFMARYEVTGLLGRGGSSSVYKCYDTRLERSVAIKLLNWGADEAMRLRLDREARIVANLSHRNIVNIFDLGTHEGQLFIVQEFLAGLDLSDVLATYTRDKGLPRVIAAKLFVAVAEALAFAHANGVVHRDIKPGNIRLLPGGEVKVLDFGIAVARHLDRMNLTQDGTQIGTPAYMSPEQLQARDVDMRSDIYSLGVVCYEALSGRMPFKSASPFEHAALVLASEHPTRLETWDVPDDVVALIDASLEKTIDARPADMTVLVRTFRAWLDRFEDQDLLSLWPAGPLSSLEPSRADRIATTAASVAAASVADTVIRPPAAPIRMPSGRGQPTERLASPVSAPPLPHVPPPADRDLVGKRVGRFTLLDLIARGRTGPFYKAYDPVRGVLVGLKLVDGKDPDVRRRLFRAGRLWLDLRHQNLVSVLEVQPDVSDYMGVIVSELVEGEPLSASRHRPQLPIENIISIGTQLCDALAYLHDRGIIHREVRPQNILVTFPECRIKLLDSGLARHANPEIDAFTKTGSVIGDMTYAPPELFTGHADQRADIYALGMTLLELVTGQQVDATKVWPFNRDAEGATKIAPAINAILKRATESNPNKRFGNVYEFVEKLQSVAPRPYTFRAPANAIITLHGIRTNASWQRTFAEIANGAGLSAHLDRWNFGYFSSLRFFLPWPRRAKVRWFRTTCEMEFPSNHTPGSRPSIVAHSFGTYIVGYALLRYPYLRLNRVLLCGSILPTGFPWDVLLDRGQVQAVRNEYGSEDVWTKLVEWFVPGTGRSGALGFSAAHTRLEQERFSFAHSEYFERGHMSSNWIPFLQRRLPQIPPTESSESPIAEGTTPWALYALYALLLGSVAAIGVFLFSAG
jgi:serine/threonine-protein kinase